MRFLLLSLLVMACLARVTPAIAKDEIDITVKPYHPERLRPVEYEIVAIDASQRLLTVKAKAVVSTFRVRPDTEVTINGLKRTFAELEPKMKVKVTLAEPGVAAGLEANGLETHSHASAPGQPDLTSPPVADFRDFSIYGSGFTIETLANDQKAFSNRPYKWKNIPDHFRGWHYTRTGGGSTAQISIRAKQDATVEIATAIDQPGLDLSSWTQTNLAFNYSDKEKTRMVVLQKRLRRGESISIPQGNWSGGLLLLPDMTPGPVGNVQHSPT